MASSPKRFNPYTYERPVVDLGEHGAFTVCDLTKTLRQYIEDGAQRLQAIPDDDDDAVILELCTQIENCLVGGANAGIAAKLAQDVDEEKLGLNGLMKMQGFLAEELGLASAEGNA